MKLFFLFLNRMAILQFIFQESIRIATFLIRKQFRLA